MFYRKYTLEKYRRSSPIFFRVIVSFFPQASKKQKLFLMSWCPDTAKVKKKMLYSSSFDALKKSLVGVQKYIQATDLSEASEEAVEEKLRATDRN